jgi:tetratricopeptide (TPR) repeat protein
MTLFEPGNPHSFKMMCGQAGWRVLLGMSLGLGPLLAVSCSRTSDASRSAAVQEASPGVATAWSEELFDYAVENLNRLEQFQSKSMLKQIVDRLNQWIPSQVAPADWKPDPLLATLPKAISGLPQLQELRTMHFSSEDGLALREVIWLRDVSLWARGTTVDELSRARNLFDWTVRNIQFAATGRDRSRPAWNLPQTPSETLLFGQGTAMDRAWVFVLLCQQQGIEAAVLVPTPLVGVLANGHCYLFDPTVGLPVPARDGVKLDRSEQLDIRPATLDEAAGDDHILRQLDVNKSYPYPVKAVQLKGLTAMIVASPESLSLRMKLVEARTAGQQKAVFSIDASSRAHRWKQVAGVSDAQLWAHPFEIVRSRSHECRSELQQWLVRLLPFDAVLGGNLWKGRLLHLKGILAGEEGASRIYQNVRPSNDDLLHDEGRRAEKYFKAARNQRPAVAAAELEAVARKQAAQETAIVQWAKQAATYWLGLVAYERQDHADSIDYLEKRTLEAAPSSFWTRGAKYNLARAYEASGQRNKAIEHYREAESDWGAQLRANWLAKRK